MIKKYLIFIAPVLFFLFFSTILLWHLPFFGDGAIYSDLIRDNYGRSVGSFDYGKYPTLYIFFASLLNKLLNNVQLSTYILNIFPTIAIYFYFYKFLRIFFSKKISYLSSFLLIFSPMFLWNISHRLFDQLSYLIMIISYYSFCLVLTKKKINFLLIFFLLLPLSKETSVILFSIVFIHWMLNIFYSYFKKNEFILLKTEGLMVIFIVFFLYLFGIFLYPKPYLNIIDKVPLLNNYFSYESDINDNSILKYISAEKYSFIEETNLRIIKKNNSIPYFYDLLIDKKIFSLVQYYSIFPVSANSSSNWFSPLSKILSLNILLFVFFLYGTICFIFNLKNKYFFVLLSSVISSLYFFSRFSIQRYTFIIQILFSVIFSISFFYFYNLKLSKNIKKIKNVVFISFLISFLSLMNYSQIRHLLRYGNSYGHNVTNEGGISDLKNISMEYPQTMSSKILTPASEPIFYLNSEVLWDWRMYFIDSEDGFKKYFTNENVSYAIIPKYSFSEHVFVNNRKQANELNYLTSTKVIPKDSYLMFLIENEIFFKKVKEYKGVVLYKIDLS